MSGASAWASPRMCSRPSPSSTNIVSSTSPGTDTAARCPGGHSSTACCSASKSVRGPSVSRTLSPLGLMNGSTSGAWTTFTAGIGGGSGWR